MYASVEEKIELLLYAWTVDWDTSYTEKWKKKKMEEKVLLFFIRMNSNTVILLNTNVFTCYL